MAPNERAKRVRTPVRYTDEDGDAELAEALAEHGDTQGLDLPNAPPIDREDGDYTARAEEEDEEEDEGDATGDESDGQSEEFDEETDEFTSARTRKPKSAEQICAERRLADGLDLLYPRDYNQIVSALRYVYHATCVGGPMEHRIAHAYRVLLFDNPLTDANREAIIAAAVVHADTVIVPEEEITTYFAPLRQYSGGFLSKLGMHMNVVSAVILMAQMVEAMAECVANGSSQAQGLALLLQTHGLEGDAVALLTQQHATETPLDSAKATGRQVAEQLNALEPLQRLRTLVGSVAGFPTRARRFQPPGYSVVRTSSALFDRTRPKGAQNLMHEAGGVDVSVSLAIDTGDQAPNAAIRKIFGEQYTTDNTCYRHVSLAPWYSYGNDRVNVPCELVATHRDAKAVYPPDRDTTYAALNEILSSTTTNLGKMLTELGVRAVDAAGCVFSRSLQIGVKYNGVWHKIGQQRKGSVSTSVMNVKQPCPGLLRIAPSTAVGHNEELASFLLPPWKSFNTGTVEFVLVISDAMAAYTHTECDYPPFLDLDWLDRSLKERKAKKAANDAVDARCALEGVEPLMDSVLETVPHRRKRRRRRLGALERVALTKDTKSGKKVLPLLERLEAAAVAAYDAAMASARPSTTIQYERLCFPSWHEINEINETARRPSHRPVFDRSLQRRITESALRDGVLARARATLAAHADMEKVKAAEPGGSAYETAGSSFAHVQAAME